MWDVNVCLVVAAINQDFTPNLSILLNHNGQLPSVSLQMGEKSILCVQKMLEDYFGFTPGWSGTTPTLKGVFENDTINIVYYLLLPQKIKQRIGNWVKIDSIYGEQENIIRYAII